MEETDKGLSWARLSLVSQGVPVSFRHCWLQGLLIGFITALCLSAVALSVSILGWPSRVGATDSSWLVLHGSHLSEMESTPFWMVPVRALEKVLMGFA